MLAPVAVAHRSVSEDSVNEELESELWEDAMNSVDRKTALRSDCDHPKYDDEHCSYSSCWNYYSKCPKHSQYGYPGNVDGRCTRMLS